jgi:hypothetical protein
VSLLKSDTERKTMDLSTLEIYEETCSHLQLTSQSQHNQTLLRNKLACVTLGVITLFVWKMAILEVPNDLGPFWLRFLPLSWLTGIVTLLHYACLPDSQPSLVLELCACVLSYVVGVRARGFEEGRG